MLFFPAPLKLLQSNDGNQRVIQAVHTTPLEGFSRIESGVRKKRKKSTDCKPNYVNLPWDVLEKVLDENFELVKVT